MKNPNKDEDAALVLGEILLLDPPIAGEGAAVLVGVAPNEDKLRGRRWLFLLPPPPLLFPPTRGATNSAKLAEGTNAVAPPGRDRTVTPSPSRRSFTCACPKRVETDMPGARMTVCVLEAPLRPPMPRPLPRDKRFIIPARSPAEVDSSAGEGVEEGLVLLARGETTVLLLVLLMLERAEAGR